jgi:hypothetical protein
MTPKEESWDMYNTFYCTVKEDVDEFTAHFIAKECVSISVDKMLSILKKYNVTQEDNLHYNQVKQELENI